MSILKLQFNKKMNSKKGLTMVETLVAISILTIAVIGPLGIIAQALHTSYYTRDQMTAHYLAQEAIEYVRNLRDMQSIAITGKFVNDPVSVPESWLDGVLYTNLSNADIPKISSIVGLPYTYSLRKDDTNGQYSFVQYTGNENVKTKGGIFGSSAPDATATQFERKIYFQRTNNTIGGADPQDFVMVVTVYWKNGSTSSKLILREYFTNWASKTGL
jgi:type II secretory pathway pseudopilin PulG